MEKKVRIKKDFSLNRTDLIAGIKKIVLERNIVRNEFRSLIGNKRKDCVQKFKLINERDVYDDVLNLFGIYSYNYMENVKRIYVKKEELQEGIERIIRSQKSLIYSIKDFNATNKEDCLTMIKLIDMEKQYDFMFKMMGINPRVYRNKRYFNIKIV